LGEFTIRVAIVDDQPLFSSGLSMLIEAQSDMECVGTALDGEEAVRLAARTHPDVMLMDLRMPVMNGLDSTRLIVEQATPARETKIIVLTTIQRDKAVFDALRAGASAFLTKDATPSTLLEAIRRAHDGRGLPEGEASLAMVKEFAKRDARSDARLLLETMTPREVEIFEFITQGLSNAEISEIAYLSQATVKSHVRAILQKLHLRSRIQVVVFAYENDIA
jgi:DNA-binding NarL/FixJ family response regulator